MIQETKVSKKEFQKMIQKQKDYESAQVKMPLLFTFYA